MSITSLPVELSLNTFSERYFKSIRFIATSDGLRNLEEIAKVQFVCERVQELWMIPTIFEGTNRLNKKTLLDHAVSSKSCERLQGHKLRVRCAKYRTMIEENRSLLVSEAFSTRLRECIAVFWCLKHSVLDFGNASHASRSLTQLDSRIIRLRFYLIHDSRKFDFWVRATSEIKSTVDSRLKVYRAFVVPG
ncbi:hypothetical protein N7501_007483 [Penicillium viridicatum]|nr:hypothetical protein N7501_007483 [Penicillium viridicatum]